jgi:hypothetical protein
MPHFSRTLSLLCAGGLTAFACTKTPTVVDRQVTVHVPAACALSSSAFGTFYPRGDYQPAAMGSNDLDFLSMVGVTLASFSSSTRSIALDVSDDSLHWCGLSSVESSGDVDALVWPYATSCALTGSFGQRSSGMLGVIDSRRALVIGGSVPGGGATPASFAIDLATGESTMLAEGLLTPRESATITAFGANAAIVAGGASPDANATPNATAEVYVAGSSAAVGDFDGMPIALSTERADHGAVVLASGATLLVGGRNTQGLVAELEAIDPTTRRARTSGLATLAVPRTSPSVMRLASGEILVASGFDADGAAVPTLEWFAPDASAPSTDTRALEVGRASAFVALPGGGALAVVAPSTSDPTCAMPGCETNDACPNNVWIIGADHAIESAPRLCDALTQVVLYPGSEGSPLLWTGARWLRWSPWGAALTAVSRDSCEHNLSALNAPIANSFVAISASLGTIGPSQTARVASPDIGLAIWLETSGSVTGLRFDTRNEYETDSTLAPLLNTGPDFFAPDQLTGDAVAFDPSSGLTLASGASAFLSDATFASVAIDLDVDPASAPNVVIRDTGGNEVDVGSVSCPFAPSPSASAGALTLHVTRNGGSVSSQWSGGTSSACVAPFAPDARVSIGLRGSNSTSYAQNFIVTRL